MPTLIHRPFRRSFPWLVALLLSCVVTAGLAQQEVDPPGRVAVLSYHQGGVVFAPEGEEDWTDLPRNRPLTVGDRLWTDRGSRAELQLGASTLRVDGESHVGLSALDEQAAQFIVQQGTVSARVRELLHGENFEIDTPNLALRALQPGDYRVDVDPNGGQTRVTVQSGRAAVFGERGESLQLAAGQQATFVRRDLAQVQGGTFRPDDFDRWAAERNRIEDQSVSARHVPRGVVGYPQLDAYGNWGQDPEYGAVWYPRVTVEDWAPYRYGRWEWIQPWGWTWVDDAPWGFAPFHYGRWTMIGNRWAWVPGSLDRRPLYAPALVVFLGGGAGFSVGSGPGVGWYPLAPGEAWWPTYRTSPRYVTHANRRINLREHARDSHDHVWRQRPWAVTAVGEDDFRHGRPVYRHRQQIQPQVIGQARVGVAPPRPFTREDRDRGRGQAPRLQAVPPRFERETGIAPAVREQWRAQREQDGLQREAERDARRQQREAQRQRGEGDPSFQRGRVRPQAGPLRQQDQPPRQPLQIREPQPQVPQERVQQQRLEQQRIRQEQNRQQRIQQQVDRQVQQQQSQEQVQQQQMQRQVQRQQERAQREAQQRLREGEQQPQRADGNRGRQLREPPAYQAPAQQAPQMQPQVRPQVRPQPPAPQVRIQEPRAERGTGRVQGDDEGPGRGRRLRD